MVADLKRELEETGSIDIDPDLTPPEVIGEIQHTPAFSRHIEELIRGANVRFELAKLQQYRMKEATNRLEKYRMDGIGQRVASIHKTLFKGLCIKHGRNWFRDPKLLHRVLEENPMLSVRCMGSRKFSICVDGLRDRTKGPAAGHAARAAVDAVAVTGDPARASRLASDSSACSAHETIPAAGPLVLSAPNGHHSRRLELAARMLFLAGGLSLLCSCQQLAPSQSEDREIGREMMENHMEAITR